MPWKEICAMDERVRFVGEALADEESMTGLCAYYGISRTTGYKWLARYRALGPEGLEERARTPHRYGLARPAEMVAAAVKLKKRFKLYGPKKLRVKLQEAHPDWVVPAASTIGDWLKRVDLVGERGRRRCCPPYEQPFGAVRASNDVWSVDFKGWFRTGRRNALRSADGERRLQPLRAGLPSGGSPRLRACPPALRGDVL
jgi:transposase